MQCLTSLPVHTRHATECLLGQLDSVMDGDLGGWNRSFAGKVSRHGSGLKNTRWVVERSLSWLHQFRRLRVRY